MGYSETAVDRNPNARERAVREAGKPITEILSESYDRNGTLKAVALELGVNRKTVHRWIQEHNGRLALVFEGETDRPTHS